MSQTKLAFNQVNGEVVSVLDFGADKTGSSSAVSAIQSAIDHVASNLEGGTVFIPEGRYRIDSTIVLSPKVSLEGEGQRGSVLQSYLSGTTPAISLDGTSVTINIHSRIEKFSIIQQTPNQGYGFLINNSAYMTYKDINTENFALHWDCRDILSSNWISVRARFGQWGFYARSTGISNPNALSFFGCVWGSMTTLGLQFDNPSVLNFYGGSIEACGSGVDNALYILNPGGQGAVGANINGMYFEGNGGTSDIRVVVNGSTVSTAVNIIGNTFNRLSNTGFTTNNILLQQVSSSDGYVSMNVIGNGFERFNTYVADVTRKYIAVQSASIYRINESGNYYSSSVEIPELFSSDVAYSSSIDVDCRAFSNDGHAHITPTDGNAFTINAPTNAVTRQRLTFTIRNNFGTLGALTFNSGASGYRLGASWTQPANGFSRSITFEYTPWGLWTEISRTAADVSN